MNVVSRLKRSWGVKKLLTLVVVHSTENKHRTSDNVGKHTKIIRQVNLEIGFLNQYF